MAMGRPMIWKSPEELQKLVDDYFQSTERWTLSGLAVHIGICRKTLYNYESKDDFLHIIKKARDKVESIYEERAIYENNPTGVIFALKNMGWSDKLSTDHTTKGESLNFDINKLSDNELRLLAEMQSKISTGKT
jgi:hypothetical protein